MTTQQLRETAIEDWMLSVSQDGEAARYDDLHVDQIDPSWRSRELWIEAGLEAFQVALKLRDQHRIPLTVAISFSLESSADPRGADFRTPTELSHLLDWSPLLYTFFFRGKSRGSGRPGQTGSIPNLKTLLFNPSTSPSC